MTITTKTVLGGTRTYEVTDKIPHGYFVWNIGESMGSDKYIPICELLHPESKGCYDIDPTTVKAIRLPRKEVMALRNAAVVGVNSLATARRAMASTRHGYWSDRKRQQAAATIAIFERITE